MPIETMNWQWTPYTILLMATSGVALLSAYYARRRRVSWIHTGIALLLAGAVWSFFYALELASPRLEAKILWSKVQYLGIVAIPIAWAAFVLQYTGREGWLKYALPVVAPLSLISLVLVWSNERHHLMWSEMALHRESYLGRSYPDLTKTNAMGYWYFIAYSGLTIVAGVYLLVQTIARSTSFYPRQHGFLLIGALAPIVVGTASVVSDIYPDHLPLVFTASTLTVLWSVAYLRKGDLVTISRRAVLQGIDDAVIVFDSGDRIISANPACQALLGHPTPEVFGQTLQEVWPELAAQLLQAEAKVRQEIVLEEGADERIYDVHISPLADWQERPIGRVAVLRDMTERHRIEREKETLQSQLLQVRRMEAIGTLAGGIAHDFNNLLTAIQGNATLAKMLLGDESPASLELAEIELACKRASRLTQQLLMFSRRQKADLVLLYLNQAIDDLVYMLRRLIGEAIEIETRLDPDLGPIYADKGNIDQVIINLVINARDAMPDGGKIVLQAENVTIEEGTALAHADARPGSFVRLAVSDTGIGMGPQVFEHLFEPFFSTKQEGAGTGLGLAISYGIVQQHRGWIEVESEVGRGSTFAVYVPMATAIKKNGTAEHETTPRELEGHGERILLVEDEKSVRAFAARVLRQHGYRVFDAADAQEATTLLAREEWRFDLLFSDVVLPDKSGLDLAEQVVAQDPTYRILLCSGYMGQRSQGDRIREQGFHFMQKPYTLAKLLGAIREAME